MPEPKHFREIKSPNTCSECKHVKLKRSIKRFICTKHDFILPRNAISLTETLRCITCDDCLPYDDED